MRVCTIYNKTHDMEKNTFNTGILLVLIFFSPLALADSGAMYEAWETGEEIITNQESSLVTGGFYYSPDGEIGEITEPPPQPEKPKWGRFKSLQEYGAIHTAPSTTTYHTTEPDYYENHEPDPFSNRINDIENLLSGE
jgi:hypothetical protein